MLQFQCQFCAVFVHAYILSSFPQHMCVSILFARSPTRILMSCQKIVAAAVTISIMELASCLVCIGSAHLRDTSCGVTIPFHLSCSAVTNHSPSNSGPHSLYHAYIHHSLVASDVTITRYYSFVTQSNTTHHPHLNPHTDCSQPSATPCFFIPTACQRPFTPSTYCPSLVTH